MAGPRPLVLVLPVVATVLLAGCSVPLVWDNPPHSPSPTVTAWGDVESGDCEFVPFPVVTYLEGVAQVGGAVSLSGARMVEVERGWWEVAARTVIHPNSLGLTAENVEPVWFFRTTAPADGGEIHGYQVDDAPAARRCLDT